MATETFSNEEFAAPAEADVECVLGRDCYGSTCLSSLANAGEITPPAKQSRVPSRTLQLKAASAFSLEDDDLRRAYQKYGEIHSTELTMQERGILYVRFCDLRSARAALTANNIEEQSLTAEFATDGAARDLDEEGRVVVRVEGHLGCNELCHIFSTYGDVRNIQDVPNITIHKVVEFFDIRCAARAVQALNAVDTDAMHAASVAYLEKTRCKLFLIPPRLPEAAGFPERGAMPTPAAPKTFPLGGAVKPSALEFELQDDRIQMADKPTPQQQPLSLPISATGTDFARSRLFDSSSSLFGSAEQLGYASLPQSTSASLTTFSCLPESIPSSFAADQSSNDSSTGLSLREVLPSGLGLYEDDETETLNSRMRYQDSASYEILSANRGSGWTPTLNNNNNGLKNLEQSCFDGFSPLTFSLMEQLGGASTAFPPGLDTSFMSEQQKQDVLILSQYLDCYEQATAFQQAVRLEVMKRLNSLKSFDTVSGDFVTGDSIFQKCRVGEDWKTAASRMHHRKKGGRFPRRNSALDLEQEAERRAQQEKMFAMDLDRVRSGKDKRTTLMIKNIPNKYTQRMLLARIEQEFKGTFDFFYLPIDFKNKCNVGYGFINMTSTEHIISFVEHVHQQKWDKFNSDKVCCVTYARIQGRHALVNHFQNSSLMLEDSKHQPLLFKPNGDPEPFPLKPVSD